MKIGHNYFVYIIECSDKSYYTGISNDVDRRVNQHNEGIDQKSYTYSRRPVKLKFFQRFDDVIQAIAFEKQLKGWTRKKKEALFNSNWEEIKKLSKTKRKDQVMVTLRPSTSSG